MKNIQQIIFQITCAFALVIFGIGCGGNVEESQQQQEVTREPAGIITFVEKDAVKGVIRGTYTLEGHEIKFESIRGAETPPAAMLIYPGVTSHSIDARVCDSLGYCFINGTGGHGMSEGDWIKEDPNREPTSDESADNFKAVWGLHQDLLQSPAGTFDGLEEEVQFLVNITNQPPESTIGIPPEYDPYHLKPQSSNKGTPQDGVLSLTLAAASTYTHILQIWRQNIVWPIAYHSSTVARGYVTQTGQIVSAYFTCNHGACALDAGMGLYCSRNFVGRSSSSLPMNAKCDEPATFKTYHPSSSFLNCCKSFYGYVPLVLSHVCNDDSKLQRDLMIAGGAIAGASYCSDGYVQGQAPSCW